MDNFIALSCPSCGEKLDISPNMRTVYCHYCGTELQVNQESNSIMLKAQVICPTCHKSDHVKKVSTFVTLGITDNDEITIKKQHCLDCKGQPYFSTELVHDNETQASILIQRLAPPKEPTMTAGTNNSKMLIIMAIICTAVASVGFIISILILLYIPAILFLFFGLYIRRKEEDIIRFQAEQMKIDMIKYKVSMERWNKLYYCDQDDFIFIPEENSSISIPYKND